MTFSIINGPANTADFTFYGGARDFAMYKGAEAILHGPAETGKTLSALNFLHLCAYKYPGCSLVIARKTLASTYSTVLQTFQNKVISSDPVQPYGGQKPEWFQYPTGSRIWIAGLDKSGKILSAEHDIIYVNQAEELMLDDWETLTTRTTGRAGNMPYSQTIGDANPAYPGHWMYTRESIRLFYSHHTDNPVLYDPLTGQLTQQGQVTISRLKNLTGMRRVRLYEGKPAQAEGVIFEDWNPAVHLITADQCPKEFPRYIAGQDWGYTHPGVLGIWGVDSDGRMYLIRQVYRTGQTIDWWVERAQELHKKYRLEAIACGPDQPAYIESYQQAGLPAVPAINDVLPGINTVQQRLQTAGDGKPRLFIVRDSLIYQDQSLIDAKKPHKTEDEFGGYVWANRQDKEQPVKVEDDGMDMARYAAMYADKPIPKAKVVMIDW